MTRILALSAAALIGLAASGPAFARSHAAAATTEAPATNQGAIPTQQFASETEAKTRCGGDTVVWANTRTHVYHFPGTAEYGHTKHGAFMCKADADKSGKLRAAKNETPAQGMTGTSTTPRR